MMQPNAGSTVEPQSQSKRAKRSGDTNTDSVTPKVRPHIKKQKSKTVQEMYKLISEKKNQDSEQGQSEQSRKANIHVCDMTSGMADHMVELADRSRINITDIATAKPVQNSDMIELNIGKVAVHVVTKRLKITEVT